MRWLKSSHSKPSTVTPDGRGHAICDLDLGHRIGAQLGGGICPDTELLN
jgi:hypothetical protein